MRIKLFVISFMLLGGCALFVVLSFMTPAQSLQKESAVNVAREIYASSKNVPLSQQVGPKLKQVAADRVECYKLTAETRIKTCAGKYLNSIVEIGKENIDSAPDMGAFINNVSRCPVVHSLCMGDFANLDQCIRLEALCIEDMLDKHWRGRPFQNR